MKQKVVTSFYETERAIDMQPVIDKFAAAGWVIKQVSTACIDRDKRPEFSKPSIAITLLMEKAD